MSSRTGKQHVPESKPSLSQPTNPFSFPGPIISTKATSFGTPLSSQLPLQPPSIPTTKVSGTTKTIEANESPSPSPYYPPKTTQNFQQKAPPFPPNPTAPFCSPPVVQQPFPLTRTPRSQLKVAPPPQFPKREGTSLDLNKIPYPNSSEYFRSFSNISAPGPLGTGLDIATLPRPLTDDEELTKVHEKYPLNCHPRFIRLTTHAIPKSKSLLRRWHLPLGAVVHPLAEASDAEKVPFVDNVLIDTLRCERCGGYINPYVTIEVGGWMWRCNLCSWHNKVPTEYFCLLDGSRKRGDMTQRPELCNGSVEYDASNSDIVKSPPFYFFLIDVTETAVCTGLLETVAKTIKSCLSDLSARNARTNIGFITFDTTVHYYHFKPNSQPKMLVMTDIYDVFLPLHKGLFVNLFDHRQEIIEFLDCLPNMFKGTSKVESAFGPALKAAQMAMVGLGGKLLVFQTALPSLDFGSLGNNADVAVYSCTYKKLALHLLKSGISVDLHSLSEKYIDIAPFGSLAKYTGGQMFFYRSSDAAMGLVRLSYELERSLKRETFWHCMLKVRCGEGLKVTNFHGNLMPEDDQQLYFPALDCDKVFTIQLSMEESVMAAQTSYIQVCILYTMSSGEKRKRVHTVAVPVVTELAEMYSQADTGATVSLLTRHSIEKMRYSDLKDVEKSMVSNLIESLKEYRDLYFIQHNLKEKFVLPNSLKLLPLYILSLSKHLALWYNHGIVYDVMTLSVSRLLRLLYPRLARVDENIMKDSQSVEQPLALTQRSLDPKGIYVLDDGLSFDIWLASFKVVDDIVGRGCDDVTQRKFTEIPKASSKRDDSGFKACSFVRQGDQPRESHLLLSSLVEDQTAEGSDYLGWFIKLSEQLK